MTDEPPLTHPGQLCASGDRAVDLALELGQARVRLAAYEAQEARIRALHNHDPLTVAIFPCPTIAAMDEPEAPT